MDLGWNFFQEVLVHVHAKGFSKGPSGTVLFRVGVNLPPPPPPPPSMNDSVTTTRTTRIGLTALIKSKFVEKYISRMNAGLETSNSFGYARTA